MTEMFIQSITKNGRELLFLMDLDLDIKIEKFILGHITSGVHYEPELFNVIMRVIDFGDVVVDVGANCGYFSCLMGLFAGQEGRLLAFEPDQRNFSRLVRNCQLCRLENTILIDRPASARKELVRFYLNDDTGSNALWDIADKNEFVDLESTTIDDEIKKHGLAIPKLIKTDTEGADHLVLEGAQETLANHKVPYIVSEILPPGLARFNSSQMKFRHFMKDFGYDTFVIYERGCLPKLIPAHTMIDHEFVISVLFSTVEDVGRAWSTEKHYASQ